MKHGRCSVLAMATTALLLLGAGVALSDVAVVDGGIEFSYDDPYAASVNLAGNFNNWSMNADALTLGEDGVWRVVKDLAPGSYEYKFVVNGSEWVADPGNPVVVGDYGNSGVTVNADGKIAASAGTEAISNTTVNSRVKLTGWYRATYDTQSDVPSDPRWRLNRPTHEFYISVDPTVNKQVSGAAMLHVSTGSGDITLIHADLYSGHLKFDGGPFSVMGWDNEEDVQFDNPLEYVGHYDLVGTIPEENIPFGRGAQGVNLNTHLWGFDLKGTYSNIYDMSIYNNPAIYDNTGTDLLAGRLKRPVGPTTLGVTYAAYMDGWWTSFQGTNESPQLSEYIAESGSTSDWFELSNTERLVSADVDLPVMSGKVDLKAEYGLYSYNGLWDMGNREKVEGESYSNGAIDVPFGDTDGWVARGVVDVFSLKPLDLELEVTRFSLDGMSADEEFVSFSGPIWWQDFGPTVQSEQFPGRAIRQYTQVTSADSPLVVNVYGPLPEFKSWDYEFEAGFGLGIFDVRMEYDYYTFEGSFIDTLDWLMAPGDFDGSTTRIAGITSAEVLPERLEVGFDFESLTHDLNMGDVLESAIGWTEPIDTFEAILSGRVAIHDDWSVLANVRHITYRDVPVATAARDSISYENKSYFAPYIALVYSPRPNVEVRLGYGIDPMSYIDTPVKGRPDGRERWRSQYLWDHSDYTVLNAEQALQDARTIGVMAVISF